MMLSNTFFEEDLHPRSFDQSFNLSYACTKHHLGIFNKILIPPITLLMIPSNRSIMALL